MPSPDSCGLHDLYASLDSKLFSIACAFVYIHMCLYISIVPNKLCSGIKQTPDKVPDGCSALSEYELIFPFVYAIFSLSTD